MCVGGGDKNGNRRDQFGRWKEGERTESDVFIWAHFGVRKEAGTMETPTDLQTMRPAKIPSNIG